MPKSELDRKFMEAIERGDKSFYHGIAKYRIDSFHVDFDKQAIRQEMRENRKRHTKKVKSILP